ncbi:MAG: ABC transporter substrate-binding protein [Actinomycetota bacterium]|nr:ABC transporter substrate-binding protein [Actinomycetota bacterium]
MALRIFIAASVSAALALGGCIGAREPEGNARDGGSVVVGGAAVPTTLDPALATELPALQALRTVYTPLLSYRHADGRDGTELMPGLARDLPQVSDDGLTYVLTLRDGLRYSSGAMLRPDDFERAVKRVRTLDSPLASLYEGIASIETDSRSRKIRVTLSAPDPAFASVLALPSSAPVPDGVSMEDLSDRPPPGIGPYRIVTVRVGRRLVLTRRLDFELPGIPTGHVDRIVYDKAGPPATQVQAVLSRSLDLMQTKPPTDMLPEIRSEYPGRYREDVAATTVALIADTVSPPLDDPVVRRAIGESLDREQVARLYGGFLETSCNLVPETMPGYRRLDPCPYDRGEPPDLVDAETQIQQAGANGAPISVRPALGLPPPVATYIVRALRKIGLDARLRGRAGARLRVKRLTSLAAHAASFVGPLAERVFDEQLNEGLADALSDTGGSAQTWAAVDERLVTEAYAVPLGSELRPSFLSDRIDTANCVLVHPILGVDLTGLCLR